MCILEHTSEEYRVYRSPKRSEKALDPPELELEMAVSHHVGTANQILVLSVSGKLA